MTPGAIAEAMVSRGDALLIQINPDSAVVAVKPDGTLLVLLAAPGPLEPEQLRRRIAAALSHERPEVLDGAPRELIVAVLGASLGQVCAQPPLELPPRWKGVAYLEVTEDRKVRAAPLRLPRPRSAARVVGWRAIVPALERALKELSLSRGAPRLDLAAVERDGEQTLAQEGAFARAGREHKPLATITLSAALCAVYVAQLVLGGHGSLAGLGRMGGAVGDAIRDGEWWRLLASTSLHGGLQHLLGNVVGLIIFGQLLETALGSSRLLVLYTLSAAGGGLAQAALRPHQMVVGASGGIFGLLAALLILSLRKRGPLPPLSRARLGRVVAALLFWSFLLSLAPHVSLAAHAGGAATGALLAICGLLTLNVRAAWSSQPEPLDAGRTSTAVAALCVAALALSLGVAVSSGRPWTLRRPSTFVAHEVPETDLQIEVPVEAAAAVVTRQKDGGVRERIGRWVVDPIVVEIAVLPRGEPTPARYLEAELGHEGAASWPGRRVEERTENGLEVAVVEGTMKGGVRYSRRVLWRAGWLVDVETVLAAGLPARWSGTFDRVARSLAPAGR